MQVFPMYIFAVRTKRSSPLTGKLLRHDVLDCYAFVVQINFLFPFEVSLHSFKYKPSALGSIKLVFYHSFREFIVCWPSLTSYSRRKRRSKPFTHVSVCIKIFCHIDEELIECRTLFIHNGTPNNYRL